MPEKLRKIILASLTALILVVQTFGYAAPAHAQISIVASVPDTVKTVLDKVFEGLKVAAVNVASTAVGYALRKISYDAAVWIASGGKGQGALVYSKGFGDYIKDVGNDAAGKAIDALSKQYGVNLCRIPDPKIDLAFRTSLRLSYTATTAPPKPSCTLTDFYNNNLTQQSWLSRFNTAEKSITQQFNETLNFDVTQGDLGIALSAKANIDNKIQASVDAAAQERQEGQGVKALTDPVSGRIKTPAAAVGQQLKDNGPSKQVDRSSNQIETIIASGNWQLLPGALANFFLNTLAGTVIKNFQTQGILPFGICVGDVGGADCQNANGVSGFDSAPGGQFTGRQAAEALFSDFLTVRITQVNQYDILSQLSTCPDSGATTYNCRADSGLVQAAQESTNGTPITLKDAIDKGFLRGDWKLIPPDNAIDTAQDCYTRAYCYSNVKVLRQVRLLPLGFEIATQNSNPDKPSTLAEVIAGFNDCDFTRDLTGAVTGVNYDPINKPFCHLIDPNWIIKAPASRCNANVYGPNLLSSDVPNRAQTCNDLTTCVGYNKDGSCINYAYCTRERNTWKFDADTCNAQYRTCRSFTDDKGNTKAYLYRSLDTAYCTKDNIGCQAYSLTQDTSGNWQPSTGVSATNDTNGIYFNNQISLNCGARSAGCSAFKVASNSSALLYLRKAPDYLKCYDSNPATPEVNLPQTRADLLRVQGSTECKNYAGVCIPDEMNCNWYTAAGGGTRIPGKYDASNICDAKCVGYSSYREMPNNYSNGQELAYVIPSSGQSCRAEEEGCSAFTNLSTAAGGLEQVEHYSYLRPCAQPDPAIQKNFITYEGSVSGFQLKTYTLVKDEITGGPKYFYRTQDDLKQYETTCNQTLYKTGTASLDCREFNDENGKVYYRLLSKTIPVDKQCNPYRLTSAETYPTDLSAADCATQKGFIDKDGRCQLCFQNGEYRNGSCFYYGLPQGTTNTAGNSVSCSASVESCHAYKGNGGNNVHDLFTDTFDLSAVPTEWKGSGLAISAESVRVGGKSLGYTGNSEIYREITLTPGKSEQINFWAKGTGQNITVSLRSIDGKVIKNFGQVTIGDFWNQYTMGPIEFLGSTTSSAQLVIRVSTSGRLYLDNVNLIEVSDYIYLVKKTLRVDSACDSNLNDNLPGEALGCTAYTDPTGRSINLTGFNYLCRENAIGCTALSDTHNTPNDSGPALYNVRLSGIAGGTATLTLGKDVFSCVVPGGETGCFVTISGHDIGEVKAAPGVSLTTSTVYIPGDTATATPMYLVANQDATCNAADLGCTYAGLQVQTPTGLKYQTTLVKNDPGSYNKTLCQAEAVGCKAYNGTGGSLYFKDPSVTGNKVCAYRTGVTVNGVKSDGWFWKSVGVCSNDKTKYCNLNQDCGTGNTCLGVGDQPCYPTYLYDGNNYGLWSSGDGVKYQNFVGECPAEQDRCTEFIDHADNNRSYYLIKNDKITGGTCDGKVSQRAGCALFDETGQPNKFYNSKATYDLSSANQFQPVQPVAGTNVIPGDSNIIIQVKRDRECGEWLQCRSSHRVWDDKTASWKMVCDAVGRCNKTPENPQEDSISNCANWVEQDPFDPPALLTANQYVKRDVSWGGMEYDGLSILNMFPVETLTQTNVAPPNSPEDWRLVHTLPCGGTNCLDPAFPDESKCKDANSPCGRGNAGTCVSGTCIQDINGVNKDVLANAHPQICRAYPEKDSPFPNSPFIRKAISQFTLANICNETANDSSDPTKAGACECDYTKVSYGDIFTRYFSATKPYGIETVVPGSTIGTIPPGICLGGTHDGYQCSSDNDCYKTVTGQPNGTASTDGSGGRIADGVCQKNKRNYKLLGWHGYCLEYDKARSLNGNATDYPCLTWYPVDHLVGTQDIDNQHTDAGYIPPGTAGGVGGGLYCLEANAPGGAGVAVTPNYPNNHIYAARDTNPLAISVSDQGQFGRVVVPATTGEAQFSQQDIERIDFQVLEPDSEDPLEGTTFSVWPNDPTQGVPQATYTTKDHACSYGTTVTGRYLGKDNQYILMYGSRVANHTLDCDKNVDGPTYVDPQGNVCYPMAKFGPIVGNVDVTPNANCQDLSGNIFKSLTSRHGGASFPYATLGSSDRTYPNGATLGQPMDTIEGIWDPNFKDEEICRAYQPTGSFSDYQGNWNAVRVRFDNLTRKFVGYDLAYCDQSKNGGAVKYKVTFKLRQWCRAVADVGTTLDQAQKSAPWTNRLYQNSKYTLGYVDPFVGFVGPSYKYTDEQAPFGSLGITTIAHPEYPLLMTSADQISECDGTCSSGGLNKLKLSDTIKIQPDFQKPVNGEPYSCVNGICILKSSVSETSSPAAVLKQPDRRQGEKFLGMLFANINSIFTYSVGPLKYVQVATPNLNITDSVNPVPKPPLIFPLGNCNAENQCVEDNSRVGFTIAGGDNGDKSSGDVIFGSPSARVFMKFFMLADQDQMPLRELTVDWGDGFKHPLPGMFRNTRGYKQSFCNALTTGTSTGKCVINEINDDYPCQADRDCTAGGTCIKAAPGAPFGKCLQQRILNTNCKFNSECPQVETCVDNASSFGKIKDKTCDSSYTQFDHVYQCYKGGPGYTNDSKNCAPGQNDCCVFTPKIQAKDNWGWCTGFCTGGPGGEGCYSALLKGGADECTSRPEASIRFGGRIIVRPSSSN